MGLLTKADSKVLKRAVPEGPPPGEILDEMGKALRERLGRLPQKKTTPHTALSLLKAYGAFQTGFCLSLKEGRYSSYASVGLGIEQFSLPQNALWSEAKARDKYFKFRFRKSPVTKNSKKDLMYWAFPLDASTHNTKEPWEAIMILGTLEFSDFNPEPVSAILDDVADKMIPPGCRKAAESDFGEAAMTQSLIEEKLNQFHQMHLEFSCIVLERPAAETSFCERVSAMVDHTGTVIPLPSDRPLILFPIMMDRELIAHRLSRTLSTKVLLSFEASNPDNALIRIDSLL